VHELHRLPDAVLKRAEQCATYLHQVHERHGAIDLETWVKNSTLVVDIHAEMESRGLDIPPETVPGWEQQKLDDGAPVYFQVDDTASGTTTAGDAPPS
jgi:hypothetical protein